MRRTLSLRRIVNLRYLAVLLLGLSLFVLSGCGSGAAKSDASGKGQDPAKSATGQVVSQVASVSSTDTFPLSAYISADDLLQAIKDNTGWQLLDIREPREFAAGHVKLALSRPLGNLEKSLAQISKEKEIVIIDLNTTRAQSAWQILLKNGYDPKKIKVLAGGMQEWRGVVSAAGSSSGAGEAKASGGSAGASKPVVQEMVGGC